VGCDGQEVAAITFISRYFFCLGNAFFAVGDRQGDLENTFVLPNYFRTDAAIFYNRDRFKASLNFNNLFDEEYFESAYSDLSVYPGEPFTVQGTVSYSHPTRRLPN
jgi:iron complex outermembrane receptor protein